MKKKLQLGVIATLFFCTASYAQVGVQAGILLPTGSWGDVWGTGFGGQVSYGIGEKSGFSYGGSVGFFRVPGDELDLGIFGTIEFPDANVIPILATTKYALSEKLYGGADVGYNVISIGDIDGAATADAGSSLALIPKVGVQLGAFSAEARYNVLGDSYISLLVGFSIGG